MASTTLRGRRLLSYSKHSLAKHLNTLENERRAWMKGVLLPLIERLPCDYTPPHAKLIPTTVQTDLEGLRDFLRSFPSIPNAPPQSQQPLPLTPLQLEADRLGRLESELMLRRARNEGLRDEEEDAHRRLGDRISSIEEYAHCLEEDLETLEVELRGVGNCVNQWADWKRHLSAPGAHSTTTVTGPDRSLLLSSTEVSRRADNSPKVSRRADDSDNRSMLSSSSHQEDSSLEPPTETPATTVLEQSVDVDHDTGIGNLPEPTLLCSAAGITIHLQTPTPPRVPLPPKRTSPIPAKSPDISSPQTNSATLTEASQDPDPAPPENPPYVGLSCPHCMILTCC